MSTNSKTLATDNPVDIDGGLVWHRLHSEREDICEALLKESATGDDTQIDCQSEADEAAGADSTQSGAQQILNEDAMHTANWHRELLQARLRKTDDALDRLMSGSYGACCKCGRWIEDTKLNFDPAIAYCIDCWDRQTRH